MKLTYDEDYSLAYISLSEGHSARQEEVESELGTLILDFDRQGHLLGIELLSLELLTEEGRRALKKRGKNIAESQEKLKKEKSAHTPGLLGRTLTHLPLVTVPAFVKRRKQEAQAVLQEGYRWLTRENPHVAHWADVTEKQETVQEESVYPLEEDYLMAFQGEEAQSQEPFEPTEEAKQADRELVAQLNADVEKLRELHEREVARAAQEHATKGGGLKQEEAQEPLGGVLPAEEEPAFVPQELQRECPTCGAAPGVPCTTKSGKASAPHKPRLKTS